MGVIETLTLALGAAWGSGINLYATVLVLGGMDLFGVVDLPPELELLSSFWVLGAALLMYMVEFLADKIPGVDSLWDMLHTFIRIPAGAALAAGAAGGLDLGLGFGEDIQTAAALITGGAVTTGAHVTKAASRAVINTSPEPVTNWIASTAEDVAVIGGVWYAAVKPMLFYIGMGIFALILLFLLPKVWRGLRSFFGGYRHPMQSAHDIRAFKKSSKHAAWINPQAVTGPPDPPPEALPGPSSKDERFEG